MNAPTKRELLELAAKASEIVVLSYVEYYDDFYWHGPSWGLIVEGVNGVWNPLEDDGDSMRLSVKLGFIVDTHGEHTRISLPFGDVMCIEAHGDDPCAATRRAIVRAAAEIALAKAAKANI